MKYFSEILGSLIPRERFLALVVLLLFTVGGFLASQWMRTDDCRSLVEENLKMQKDFVKISEMLRDEIMKRNPVVMIDDTRPKEIYLDSAEAIPPTVSDEEENKIEHNPVSTPERKPASSGDEISNVSFLVDIQKIAESNIKK